MLLAALVAASIAAAAPPLVVPGDATPEAVTALGPLDRASAFAVSADGAVAVCARPSERAEGRSVVRIGRADGTAAELELPGSVPGLVVAPSGDLAFAIVRETDRKGAIRRVVLLRVDLAAARGTSEAALPSTASGLAFASGQASILVAAKDELRSFRLPELTSGPLYRLAGANGAVAVLAGTSRVLVAQGARLAVVDLASPQDRNGLPIADTVEASSPVRMLAASPDEPVGLALLQGGSVVAVETEPLRLVPTAPAVAIAWPGVPAPGPPPPPPVAAVPTTVAAVAAVEAAAAQPAPPRVSEPEPESASAPPPPPEPEQEPVVPPPPPPSPPAGEPGTVTGRLAGPARGLVREVTLLGPDNILKEAARVVPDPSGGYSVRELKTGSYRIVAAGENGRVLVCDPPYVTVKVGSGAAVEAPALNVLRAY